MIGSFFIIPHRDTDMFDSRLRHPTLGPDGRNIYPRAELGALKLG